MPANAAADAIVDVAAKGMVVVVVVVVPERMSSTMTVYRIVVLPGSGSSCMVIAS